MKTPLKTVFCKYSCLMLFPLLSYTSYLPYRSYNRESHRDMFNYARRLPGKEQFKEQTKDAQKKITQDWEQTDFGKLLFEAEENFKARHNRKPDENEQQQLETEVQGMLKTWETELADDINRELGIFLAQKISLPSLHELAEKAAHEAMAINPGFTDDMQKDKEAWIKEYETRTSPLKDEEHTRLDNFFSGISDTGIENSMAKTTFIEEIAKQKNRITGMLLSITEGLGKKGLNAFLGKRQKEKAVEEDRISISGYNLYENGLAADNPAQLVLNEAAVLARESLAAVSELNRGLEESMEKSPSIQAAVETLDSAYQEKIKAEIARGLMRFDEAGKKLLAAYETWKQKNELNFRLAYNEWIKAEQTLQDMRLDWQNSLNEEFNRADLLWKETIERAQKEESLSLTNLQQILDLRLNNENAFLSSFGDDAACAFSVDNASLDAARETLKDMAVNSVPGPITISADTLCIVFGHRQDIGRPGAVFLDSRTVLIPVGNGITRTYTRESIEGSFLVGYSRNNGGGTGSIYYSAMYKTRWVGWEYVPPVILNGVVIIPGYNRAVDSFEDYDYGENMYHGHGAQFQYDFESWGGSRLAELKLYTGLIDENIEVSQRLLSLRSGLLDKIQSDYESLFFGTGASDGLLIKSSENDSLYAHTEKERNYRLLCEQESSLAREYERKKRLFEYSVYPHWSVAAKADAENSMEEAYDLYRGAEAVFRSLKEEAGIFYETSISNLDGRLGSAISSRNAYALEFENRKQQYEAASVRYLNNRGGEELNALKNAVNEYRRAEENLKQAENTLSSLKREEQNITAEYMLKMKSADESFESLQKLYEDYRLKNDLYVYLANVDYLSKERIQAEFNAAESALGESRAQLALCRNELESISNAYGSDAGFNLFFSDQKSRLEDAARGAENTEACTNENMKYMNRLFYSNINFDSRAAASGIVRLYLDYLETAADSDNSVLYGLCQTLLQASSSFLFENERRGETGLQMARNEDKYRQIRYEYDLWKNMSEDIALYGNKSWDKSMSELNEAFRAFNNDYALQSYLAESVWLAKENMLEEFRTSWLRESDEKIKAGQYEAFSRDLEKDSMKMAEITLANLPALPETDLEKCRQVVKDAKKNIMIKADNSLLTFSSGIDTLFHNNAAGKHYFGRSGEIADKFKSEMENYETVMQKAQIIELYQTAVQTAEGYTGAAKDAEFKTEESFRGAMTAGNYEYRGDEYERSVVVDSTAKSNEYKKQYVPAYKKLDALNLTAALELKNVLSVDPLVAKVIILGELEEMNRKFASYMGTDDLHKEGKEKELAAKAGLYRHIGIQNTYAEDVQNNPLGIIDMGWGYTKDIMHSMRANDMEAARGKIEYDKPWWKKRLWDDDINNDGKRDADKVKSVDFTSAWKWVNNAAGSIISYATGQQWIGACISTFWNQVDHVATGIHYRESAKSITLNVFKDAAVGGVSAAAGFAGQAAGKAVSGAAKGLTTAAQKGMETAASAGSAVLQSSISFSGNTLVNGVVLSGDKIRWGYTKENAGGLAREYGKTILVSGASALVSGSIGSAAGGSEIAGRGMSLVSGMASSGIRSAITGEDFVLDTGMGFSLNFSDMARGNTGVEMFTGELVFASMIGMGIRERVQRRALERSTNPTVPVNKGTAEDTASSEAVIKKKDEDVVSGDDSDGDGEKPGEQPKTEGEKVTERAEDTTKKLDSQKNVKEKTIPDKTMLDEEGYLKKEYITKKKVNDIDKNDVDGFNAIVLHRTDGSSAEGAINSFEKNNLGTHFLVDKDGTVYQLTTLDKNTTHVGNIKSKSQQEKTMTTADKTEISKIQKEKTSYSDYVKKLNDYENKKNYPDRYPTSLDSVGIEVVGKYDKVLKQWELAPQIQLNSVNTLVQDLMKLYSFNSNDIYHHDVISYKTKGEGAGLGY